MNQKNTEHQKVNPKSLITGITLSILPAFLLGHLYAIINLFMPIVYINIILPGMLALGIGICVYPISKISHSVSLKERLLITLFMGILASFIQWSVYILYALNEELPTLSFLLHNILELMNPIAFFKIVSEINTYGMWQIGSIVFKGTPLALMWLAEFLIIIGLPLFAVNKTKVPPYSHVLNKWYPSFEISLELAPIYATEKLEEDLSTSPLNAILNAGRGNGNRFTRCYIYYLKDAEIQYISFKRVTINRKGKESSEFVIHNAPISKPQAVEILDKLPHQMENTSLWFPHFQNLLSA